jgi:hypothetical protein
MASVVGFTPMITAASSWSWEFQSFANHRHWIVVIRFKHKKLGHAERLGRTILGVSERA